jgi:serine/threonine protein kinase
MKGSYTSKADLWSIGMVFYHMLYGEYPFYGLSRPELMANIREKSGTILSPRQ